MAPDHLIPIDAEQILVGQVLLSGDVITKAAQLLRPEHLGDPVCRQTFEAALAVWRDGRNVDLLTVANEVRKQSNSGASVTMAELAGFTNRVSSTVHFEDHAAIVKEHYAARVLRETGEALVAGTMKATDPLELLAPASDALQRVALVEDTPDVNAGKRAFELMNTTSQAKPIYMGVANLDSMVWMLPGNLVTVRADAGVGKTAFVLSVVLNLMPRIKPWFVSLEMPADELILRAMCQIAMVDIDRAMLGHYEPYERERMALAASQYADILGTLEIDDSGSMTTDEFMAKAEHRVKNGAGLIVVDYAQLMSADKKLYPNQSSELEAISKCIRSTARKLSVPILCIVHVNKLGEDHGTSQFEKDAHVRLHLKRERGADHMDIEIMKNRNGRPGAVDTPCSMRYGMVGRVSPPVWVNTLKPPTTRPSQHPDNRIEPQTPDDYAPF